MKSAVLPPIRVEPELRADLEAVLRQGETRAQAASEAYHQTGVSVPVEAVLKRLQSKLDAKRKKLGR